MSDKGKQNPIASTMENENHEFVALIVCMNWFQSLMKEENWMQK